MASILQTLQGQLWKTAERAQYPLPSCFPDLCLPQQLLTRFPGPSSPSLPAKACSLLTKLWTYALPGASPRHLCSSLSIHSFINPSIDSLTHETFTESLLPGKFSSRPCEGDRKVRENCLTVS